MQRSRLVAAVVVLGTAGCGDGPPDLWKQSCGTGPRGQSSVDVPSLLKQTWDLHVSSRMPDPRFQSLQASSYDRRSETPDEPEAWFANRDSGHFVRRARVDGRSEWVLAELEGPGAITRLWSATPQGTLRVYLDCQREPVIDAPMTDVLSNDRSPFDAPFAYAVTEVSRHMRGGNLYFPIPFQHGALVTTDVRVRHAMPERHPMFYHVGHRRYPEDTVVETFSEQAVRAAREQKQRAEMMLSEPQVQMRSDSGVRSLARSLDANRSQSMELEADEQGSTVVELRVTPNTTEREILQSTLFTARFDGRETIRVPLGELFAVDGSRDEWHSLPMEVEGDTLVVRWPMPFRDTATFTVAAAEQPNVDTEIEVVVAPRPWDERSLYFNAGWRASGRMRAERQDWNFAHLEGRGVYVGSTLRFVNTSRCWWGEGDERIRVDGEAFPSHFGTGTEDYYGYAWAQPQPFIRPFHGMPRHDTGRGVDDCGHGENLGGTAFMYRWHVLDPIPFKEKLRFDMEVWHWNPSAPIAMSTVSYWYATADTTDAFPDVEPGQPTLRTVGDLEGP